MSEQSRADVEEQDLDIGKIPPEAFTLKVIDGRPVIEIGQTRIQFNVHCREPLEENSFHTRGDAVAELESNGDVVWWTVCEDIEDAYVEVEPALTYVDGADGGPADAADGGEQV